MRLTKFFPNPFFLSMILTLFTTPALAQEKSSIAVDKSVAKSEKSNQSSQQPLLVTNSQFVKPITDIRRVSEIERPAKSASLLVQSPIPSKT